MIDPLAYRRQRLVDAITLACVSFVALWLGRTILRREGEWFLPLLVIGVRLLNDVLDAEAGNE